MRVILKSIITFLLLINSVNAKDYNFKKVKIYFEENSNVYKIKYSNSCDKDTSKTTAYFETNKSGELISLFIGYHLPLTSNPRWVMDTMRETLLKSKKSPLSNKETFNLSKNTTSRHLFVGEIEIRKMQKNMFFNLNTMINRAKKKHNISIPDKLLSSIHVSINSKGIYFISYLTNENQKSSIDDWINLSLAREKILSKTLKLKTLETNFEMKEEEDYYFKKFKGNTVLTAKKNENQKNKQKTNDIVKKEDKKKKKEKLANKQTEEEKKAEDERKKQELLAKQKA